MSGTPAGRAVGTSSRVSRLRVMFSPSLPSPRVAADHQPALDIAQRCRQPVDLRLGHHGDRVAVGEAEEPAHPALELAHILGVEGVGQRQHRARVSDLGEALGRARCHPLAGAVGPLQIRKALLDRRVAAPQGVVFRVRQDRRVLDVVGTIGVGDGGGEAAQLVPGLGFAQRVDRLAGGGVGVAGGHRAAPTVRVPLDCDSRLSAAARASAVTAAPDSIRAISSRRAAASREATVVAAESPLARFSTRQ